MKQNEPSQFILHFLKPYSTLTHAPFSIVVHTQYRIEHGSTDTTFNTVSKQVLSLVHCTVHHYTIHGYMGKD